MHSSHKLPRFALTRHAVPKTKRMDRTRILNKQAAVLTRGSFKQNWIKKATGAVEHAVAEKLCVYLNDQQAHSDKAFPTPAFLVDKEKMVLPMKYTVSILKSSFITVRVYHYSGGCVKNF
jgi:hypothetical protein